MLNRIKKTSAASIVAQSSGKGTTPSKRNARWARFVDAADKAVFTWKVRRQLYKHLAAQVGNSVPVETALDRHGAQLARKKKPSSARIVKDASRLMRDGKSLAQSLEKWIPADEAGLISAAESAGVLPESLKELIATKRRVKRVTKAFRNAIIRPAVYSATIYLVVWAIGKYAVPELVQAYPVSEARGAVAVLFAAGSFSQSLAALLPPAGLLLAGWVIRSALPRWRGRFRIAAESYFPFSFYRDMQGFMWLSSFISLLEAGKPDVDILKQQTRFASPYLKERLVHFRRVMVDGKSLTDALLAPSSKGAPAFGFPNPDIVEDIESFAGFADFAERIKTVLKEWVDDLEETTLEQAAVFGFSLEIFMYVVMGFLMYAINEIATHAHI
ncbi:type II secretion system F family protein [Paraburkholderia largidicola]|uniref:Type II secretion system protein F n=1 Tax=Paraburkholderia largidicola TaxID=3014751 RepID=A0A7I8C6Q3_9BURK|nr:type II secretion system F family protein [Paraburkholderia sp. PGU16]BCF95430.1 type II secretion system protein F [Paraburkholderia sp. PGU16]